MFFRAEPAGSYRYLQIVHSVERSKAKDPAPLKIKEVWVEDGRYVV